MTRGKRWTSTYDRYRSDLEQYIDVRVLIPVINEYVLLHLNEQYASDDIVNVEVCVDHEHSVRRVYSNERKKQSFLINCDRSLYFRSFCSSSIRR